MPLLIPTIPNSELVTLAWLRTLLDPYAAAVGTTLQGPKPDTQILEWGDTGFVTATVVGGSVNGTVPVRQPVMSVDTYAYNAKGGTRPPWGRANSLAEIIVQASYSTQWGAAMGPVTLPTGFGAARVSDASVRSEPERRPSDEAGYARYGFELEISWVYL